MHTIQTQHAPHDPALADRHAALHAALPTATPGQPRDEVPHPSWVPIRSLAPKHRHRILAHLLALPERDRYLRFGYPATDGQITRYVEALNFERDEVFGIYNRHIQLIALAHLAFAGDGGPGGPGAEFGGSVLPHARGRGYGARLFEHAMLHARNGHVDTLYIHALSENTVMLRIARKAGAIVQRSGSESDAYLRLPPETLASQVEQWVGEGAAAIDYQIKRQTRRVGSLIEAIGEVKSGVARPGQAARD
ncbi:GNAT family N-acetyltransferase [Ideonella sp. DXS22W]|uniref:GNAT family N-acetyltransferase n=1 Tax=Pseudaquabacterium inlustre TaxID=2984192 RepID=A0ABU9CNG0_9BURK